MLLKLKFVSIFVYIKNLLAIQYIIMHIRKYINSLPVDNVLNIITVLGVTRY